MIKTFAKKKSVKKNKSSRIYINVSIFVLSLLLLSAMIMPTAFASEGKELGLSSAASSDDELFGALYEEFPVNIYTPSLRSPLPSSVNLVTDEATKNYFPPIRRQEGGSCSAWATTYYQFTYEAARLNNWNASNDDSKVFSPKYVWNYLNNGENKGVKRSDCFDLLKKQGAVRWSQFPQNDTSLDWYQGANDTATRNALHQALETRLTNYYSNNFFMSYNGDKDTDTDPSEVDQTPIDNNKDSDLNGMKQLLSEGHVLTMETYVCNFVYGVVTDENGEATTENVIRYGREKYGTNKEEKLSITGHALTIVGYDDNIHCDWDEDGQRDATELGAFLIANSWGPGADNHNSGFVWLMYDALNNISNDPENNVTLSDNFTPSADADGPRKGFISDNAYHYIEVANFTPELTAEVTVQQTKRNDFSIWLGASDTKTSTPTYEKTKISEKGGALNFDGTTSSSAQTRTFVFDYADLYDGEDKVYWVKVEDLDGNNGANTTVTKIRWVDENGTVVKEIGQQSALSGSEGSYYRGVLADSISMNKTSSSLYIGKVETLRATVSPSNTTDPKVVWASSNPNVVTVTSSGLVRCVGKGISIVTATTTDGSELSAFCMYNINEDYGNDAGTSFPVEVDTKTNGTIETSGDVDYFRFIPKENATYLFYTTGSVDTKGYLYDRNKNQIDYNDDIDIDTDTNFIIQCTLTKNQPYYIKVGAYSTGTGNYTLNISKDFYEAGFGVYDNEEMEKYNQDARNVQMYAEAASFLTSLKLTLRGTTYTLNKPTSGNLDTTIGGYRFKVEFESNNNGLSTIWNISASIPPTAVGTTDTVSFDFSTDIIADVTSQDYTGLFAYDVSIKTGIDARATNNLQLLVNSMSETGYRFEVVNWDNSSVSVTSTTKAATGMKIKKINNTTNITEEIFFLVLFGDVTGGGTICIGDGNIAPADALAVLQDEVNLSQLAGLALIAADTDHDGDIDANDALLINQHNVKLIDINQNYTAVNVPDDCY